MKLLSHITSIVIILAIGLGIAYADNADDTLKYLQKLPSDLQLKEDSPQKYRFICDYLTLDKTGDLTMKKRVSGDYTRAMPDGKVKWNDVNIAQAKTFGDEFPKGEKQDFMENFTYKPEDIVKPDIFQGFPPMAMETKSLVWDTVMIESFGWLFFDKLELNKTYISKEIQGDVPLSGSGIFNNRQIELTWLGVSEMNQELCALIQYRAFINKMSMDLQGMSMQGRSHYWGEIWVSLKDKQIEHATLYEDVILDIKTPNMPTSQLANIFRIGTFQKLP